MGKSLRQRRAASIMWPWRGACVWLCLGLSHCNTLTGAADLEVQQALCVVNETRTCVGPASCAGAQTCLGDGYSACDCGDAPATPVASSGGSCLQGRVVPCTGPGGCVGEQSCLGGSYSSCSCALDGAAMPGLGASGEGLPYAPPLNPASAGGAGALPAGGAGGAGGANEANGDASGPLVSGGVGVPCVQDADCPRAPDGSVVLTCVSASSTAEFGGGPQGGYCTAPCQFERANVDCQALDDLSACNGNGYCIGLCGVGEGGTKCGGGRAQACVPIPDGDSLGACVPVCQSDAACGARFCSLGSLCVDELPSGGGIGAPCTREVDCEGSVCLSFSDPSGATVGACSALCTVGSLAGCGFDELTASTRDAACLVPAVPPAVPGDAGYCVELCDTDTDCFQGGWVCQSLAADLSAVVGRLGQCVPGV